MIFVYGTLLRGESNHRLLRRATFIREATSQPSFDLVDLGAFPAMIAGGQTAVCGEIYEVDEATLTRLDHLEGHPSFYVRTTIMLEHGLEAETYLLPGAQASGARRIACGSWRARHADPTCPHPKRDRE
jgi:gamma-glutamylaminecyclotransferase